MCHWIVPISRVLVDDIIQQHIIKENHIDFNIKALIGKLFIGLTTQSNDGNFERTPMDGFFLEDIDTPEKVNSAYGDNWTTPAKEEQWHKMGEG